jgi:hypothetical protein
MPEGDNTNDMYKAPEELLAGADHPRPLPPQLRAQLEELLEGTRTGTVARPLPGDVRDKLEVSLLPDEPQNPENPEYPKPEKQWRKWAPRLSVAAAVIIALAIFVPTLSHGPGPSASHVAAGTESTRSGPSILRAVPPTASGSKAAGTGNSQTYGTSGPANGAATASPSTSAAASASTTNLAERAGRAAAPAAPPALRPAASGPLTPGSPTSGWTKSHAGAPEAVLGAPPPVVSGLSPATGPVGGGNWVVVRGTDLGAAKAVYFGGVPAARLSAGSGTELKAMAPAHSAGTVDVVVSGPGGRSQVSAADRYSFTRAGS